jgi:hypothetical protein
MLDNNPTNASNNLLSEHKISPVQLDLVNQARGLRPIFTTKDYLHNSMAENNGTTLGIIKRMLRGETKV